MNADSFQAAVSFAAGAPLELRSVSLDTPQADEVLVSVKACAICHSDLLYISGAWKVPLPAVFGHEAAGEILAVGERSDSAAQDLAVGDRVVVSLLRACGSCPACVRGEESLCLTKTRLDECSPLCLLEGEQKGTRLHHGLRTAAFAERVLLARSQVVKIPPAIDDALDDTLDNALDNTLDDTLDDTLACLLGCGVLTGFGAVANVANPPEGSHLVIIGCGGVGLNCVQAARLTKPKTNIAIDPSSVKRTTAVELGATHTYLPSSDLPKEVHAATHGGADFVFVAVGNVQAMTLGFEMLRDGGCMVVVGMTREGETLALDTSMLSTHGKTVRGSKMGGARLAHDVPKLIDLHARGEWNLEKLTGKKFPFADINAALDTARSEDALRSLIVF